MIRADQSGVAEISDGRITARVSAAGSEVLSLRTAEGTEVLWNAGPQWPRHAPILFPAIGRSPNDTVHVDGRTYPMPQHGFARDRVFARTGVGSDHVDFELRSDDTSRQHYPYDFVLGVRHAVVDGALNSTYEVTNIGDSVMPASFGLHPAFVWPMRADARTSSRIVFARNEPDPVRRVREVLLLPRRFESPVTGNMLELRDALFDDGAVVFDFLQSTRARFETADRPTVTLSWRGFDGFAVWSPPDRAQFLCLEPWFGLPAPVDFVGDLTAKPAQFHLAPGDTRSFALTIDIDASP